MAKCPICGRPDTPTSRGEGKAERVECPRCGTFVITEYGAQMISEAGRFAPEDPGLNWAWSGALRKRSELGAEPVVNGPDDLRSMVPERRDLLRSLDALLTHVYRSTEAFGKRVSLEADRDYPVAMAKSGAELAHLVDTAVEMGYLGGERSFDDDREVLLTPEGWARVIRLGADRALPEQAFVAMWFGGEVASAYADGIAPALRDCGYSPFRVDAPEHNGKIDDLIVSEIRRSGLLVADFTGHRGGVYFEAGLAMGLGIPVVWTCRADHIDDAHFDTRQYNHVVWEAPEDLREKLRTRIAATAPRTR